MLDFLTEVIIVRGGDTTSEIAHDLVAVRSAAFAVVPLPDDELEFYIRKDQVEWFKKVFSRSIVYSD